MSKEFTIGDKVRVVALPAYVKTAESMPMLRPPNVIKIGEEGTILDRQPGGYWSVRFTNGAFLLESQYIESAREEQPPPETESDTGPDPLAPEEN
ncbi:regulatory protein SipA [Phormidium sp. CCY1219]|uniref:regulatory protein SipA n=1 Tax=Phormidium sp. CCY1219 TaxID=2886104 RepID=UPI002D1F961D|nr:DUF3148 domain-containing protein [Phormidium sp. CCY1219]MEB3829041.1 DUF3148 domain-containing protein [Phormidium sp. CCY1219]